MIKKTPDMYPPSASEKPGLLRVQRFDYNITAGIERSLERVLEVQAASEA